MFHTSVDMKGGEKKLIISGAFFFFRFNWVFALGVSFVVSIRWLDELCVLFALLIRKESVCRSSFQRGKMEYFNW